MKFFFCLVILLSILIHVSAQNTGIGTSTPSAKLTIAHTSSLSVPTLGLFDFTSTGGPQVSFRNAGGGSEWFITSIIDNATPANSFLKFSYVNDVFPTLTIRGNGNTGINQSVPAFPLDVTGDINLTGRLRINNSAGTAGQALLSNGASAPTWQTITQNPAIGFSARLNGNVAISGGTPVTLTTFTELFDDGNSFNPATGQFTAPSSGIYQFHMQANFAAPTLANSAFVVTFQKNGGTFAGNQAYTISPPDDGFIVGISHTVNLLLFTGDIITVQVNHFAAEILNINGGGSSATSMFSGFKVY